MSSKKYALLKGLSAVSEMLHWSNWLKHIKKKKNVALLILITCLYLASASSIVSSPEPKENQSYKQYKILKQYQILLINYTSSDSEEIICKKIHEHALNQFWSVSITCAAARVYAGLPLIIFLMSVFSCAIFFIENN